MLVPTGYLILSHGRQSDSSHKIELTCNCKYYLTSFLKLAQLFKLGRRSDVTFPFLWKENALFTLKGPLDIIFANKNPGASNHGLSQSWNP